MHKLQTPRPNPIALTLSSILLASSMQTYAQGMMLEEVIVTAEKREAGAQDTPISLVALSSNDLDNRGIATAQDLLKNVVGLGGNISPGSRGTTAISIRGASSGAPANLSNDPVVGQYVDGIYIGKIVGSTMDVAEIERIEVLRGPQGTLYGRNSTAGAVNVITRKPSGEFGVRATGSVGNEGYYSGKIALDLPAVGTVGEGLGELAINLGAHMRKRDELYGRVGGSGGFDELDRQAYRIALQWTPSDNFFADYSYDYSELDEAGAAQPVVAFNPLDAAGNVSQIAALQGILSQARGWAATPGTDPRIGSRWIPSLEKTISAYQAAEAAGEGRSSNSSADFLPTSDNTVDGHALTLTWDAGDLGALGDVTFKSLTGYREVETYVFGDLESIDSRQDASGAGAYPSLVHQTLGALYGATGGFDPKIPQLPFDGLWNAIDTVGAFDTKQDTRSEYEQFSQEFQMIGATDRMDYALGLYYFEDEANYRRDAIFLAPLGGVGSQDYDLESEALAIYGQTTWRPQVLDDRLALTLGLRYTEETKDVFWDYGENVSPFGVTPARSQRDDQNFYNGSGNFTIAYDATDEMNIYLRYATGYRSGNFNGEVFGNMFDEETIEQWEIGLKSDWWDNRLRINGAIYTYVYEDLQVSQIKASATGAQTSLTSNAGEADRWGGEIEITVVPFENMIASLGYSYVHGDFEEFPDTCTFNPDGSPIACLDGAKAALRGTSPSNQLNVSLDYTFAYTSYGEITGFLQANWADEWAESALWTGAVGDTPVNYPHQMMDQRTLVTARLSLEQIPVGDGMMRVSLWGNNLLDDDYPTFSINFGGALGLITEQYGEPRTYGLELNYEY
ncbi:TonB-dependent receptor [Seongchinamella sediminis]|uniref:TonB-dependent receptor n=1 Tax=Seongchinamella sediminis TaxID=2283635 RepID=A0A3L7DUW8_9GAMM|nr:TonB-dependent receptor [Seongchinamella sediminis]RLQ21358.1 TonB-dependent receptor [Seongchinamella sediminis]